MRKPRRQSVSPGETPPRYRRGQARLNRTETAVVAQAVADGLRPEAIRLLDATLTADKRLPAAIATALEESVAGAIGPLAHDLVARRLRPIAGLIPSDATDQDIEAIARRLSRS